MSNDVTIVGIDPGLDGGVAVLTPEDELIATVMPVLGTGAGRREVDIKELDVWLDGALREVPIVGFHKVLVVLEKVGPMPKQGVTSTFTFGRDYGKLLALAALNGWSLENPMPQQWKRVILAGTAKDKDAAIAYMQRRYPGVELRASTRCKKPHHGIADAGCLAEYGRRILGGAK